MKLGQAFKMAFKSIGGNKGRSFLTMLGIIIGVASVMAIVSVLMGMNKKSLEMYEKMGSNRIQVSAYRYDGVSVFEDLYDYCLYLTEQVDGVTPNAYVSATVTYGNKTSDSMDQRPDMYFGSDQYGVVNNFQIEKGRDLSKIDIDNYANVCVMGGRAARNFFDATDPVGKEVRVNGVPFTVIGVYAEKDADNISWSLDNVIVFPYTAARALQQDTRDMNEFYVKAKTASAATEATTLINGFLTGICGDRNDWNNQKGYFYVENANQWSESGNEYAKMMSLVLGGIAAISLLVGGIGIMNIMLVTVTERTREIGIRRAIGAERKSIVSQFLIEAGMICGIGGIFGVTLGTILTLVGGKLLLQMVIWPSFSITVGALAFSVVLGVIFGMYPAIKASGLQPVVALRAE
ncbi:MAG: FtsX-like permease family protein [Oscillospiraceae bacterium]|nr:FtsX-like permease family protein [Oscillospiraceae bacterium]